MTTMGDVVTGALKRLRVINPRHTPDGISASDGLIALNEMMHAWKAQGVDTDHEDLKLTDDFPLDAQFVQGTKALLCVRLASDYGLSVDAGVAKDAADGWSGLQAAFVDPAPRASFDHGLTHMTLGRRM